MKQNLHPDYHEVTVVCACGETFKTGSTKRGEEIGYENVFDYSLGNPSVPVAQEFTDCMIKLLQEENPMALHGYSQSLGIPAVRQKVAASLAKRFDIPYTMDENGNEKTCTHKYELLFDPTYLKLLNVPKNAKIDLHYA